MKYNYSELIKEKTKESIKEFLEKNSELTKNFLQSEINHLVLVGITLLMSYWDEYEPNMGSFIENFLNNDLRGTLAKCDEFNLKSLKIYQMMIDNIKMPYID